MKTINLTLTEQETGILMAVIDAGCKAAGVQVVRPLAPVLAKIEAAIAAMEEDDRQPELDISKAS